VKKGRRQEFGDGSRHVTGFKNLGEEKKKKEKNKKGSINKRRVCGEERPFPLISWKTNS